MITKRNVLFLSFCLALTGMLQAADSVIVFSDLHKSELIGKRVYILKDETNKMDFNQVTRSEGFVASTDEVPNLGVTPHTYWVRFSIKNLTDQQTLLLSFTQPFMNEVMLVSPDSNGKYAVQLSGDDYPFAFRVYRNPNFVFLIDIGQGETKTYYMKVKSDEQILLPLTVGERTMIIRELHYRDLIFGGYCGIMLAMLFYNLFIYFTVKDRIYLWYVIYIFFIWFTQANILGYPFEFLWPNNPYFANISIDVFSCGVGLVSLEFLKRFLHTKQFAPRLHKISYVISGLYTLGLLITLSGVNMNVAYLSIQANAVLVAIFMLIVPVVISRQYKPAKFFLVAWSSMLVGIILFVLKDFGILPTNVFTSYTMPIGSALETILLALALADRINGLKMEKEQSQAEALLISQQNQKLITEQNIILEQKVHERTIELEETNEELNVALNHLKDTQTQLVNVEKMASLGQLTAGIAHEINNPINFVSANLKPLKLDISEVFELIRKYEALAAGDQVHEHLKEIDDFKKEIDIDYLRSEIGTLLHGIEDGARRTTEIVSGLKNFSRLDESEIKEANINEGIESTLVILRSSIPNGTEVVTNLEKLPMIECYPGKLNQVFMNIMSNAIYAIRQKKDGEDNKLTISTFMKGDFIYATFEDTGIGMTPEVKEKIFEPFFTTKDVGEGTGLGMSIVFKIIESHHAKLEIESKSGVGTKVVLALNKRLGDKIRKPETPLFVIHPEGP